MKLFLASEAKHPQSLAYLEEFVSGFADKSIAYIPTARNGERGWGDWLNSESWQVIQKLSNKVKSVLLEEYHTSVTRNELRKLLSEQDIIWVGGGFVGYLMYWLHCSEVSKNLEEIIQRNSSNPAPIYVGSSAGSMVTGQSLATAEWDFMGEEWGDAEIGAHYLPGLGLVDFDFLPHYQEHLLPRIKQNYSGKRLYLVKDGEALTVSSTASPSTLQLDFLSQENLPSKGRLLES